eukprot:scaffold17974_cov69-Phaeocystis_antarctica.AAC.2
MATAAAVRATAVPTETAVAGTAKSDCLGRVGGDLTQRHIAHFTSEAPREHGGALILDERRRVDGRLQQRPVSRCVDRLPAVREEQHDLSRILAGITVVDSVEEVPHGFKAVGDRGLAVRRHIVDSVVDLGLVVRPSHARRRVCREGHHREARRIYAEGAEHAHQLVGEGF